MRGLDGHGVDVHGLAFPPDGKTMVSTGQNGIIRLWDIDSGRLIRSLEEYPGHVFRTAYSNDGTMLATASDGAVRLWSSDGRTLNHTLANGGQGFVAEFSPDGRLLATSGNNRQIALWAVR